MVDVHFLKGGEWGSKNVHFGKWLTIMDDPLSNLPQQIQPLEMGQHRAVRFAFGKVLLQQRALSFTKMFHVLGLEPLETDEQITEW